MRKICNTCRFFTLIDSNKNQGECHRYPPKSMGDWDSSGVSLFRFPVVRPTDWCGELKTAT